MNRDNREIRTVCREVRARPENENGTVRFEGYAAVFDILSGDLGGFREKIERGAFRNAIERKDDVRALFNHDPNYVLGRTGAGTVRLAEDDHGLHFEIDAPDIGWVRDLRESVKRGDIDQCSFAFTVDAEEWDERDREHPIRTLKDVRLYDVSLVTYPAYEATSAQARNAAGERDETSPGRCAATLLPRTQPCPSSRTAGRQGFVNGRGLQAPWRRRIAERRMALREAERPNRGGI